MTLSQKFPPSIKPATPGVYLTQRPTSPCAFWRAFDGEDWRYGASVSGKDASPSYEDALHKAKIPSNMANFDWQGLAEKPYGVLKLTREEMDRIHNP
jgi:hypothetical protein